MMYGSWDMKCDRQDFLSFWTFFCPFTQLTTQKIKILKNWKKITGNIITLHKCNKNHDHMLHCPLDMAHNGFNYFSFWAIFYPFTSLTAQKTKIYKKWKKLLEISSFYNSASKIMIRSCTVPEMWCANIWTDGGTDGRTDKWKKWHIEVCAPPKKTW